MLHNLPSMSRHLFAALLATCGLAYAALLVTTYLMTTAPSSLAPDLGELQRLLFVAARPVSAMERRLAASDIPLGAGPLISSGIAMPIPFTGQSEPLSAA